MYVKIFSKAYPCYVERMVIMGQRASIWMRTDNCCLELLPKE